MKKEFSAIIIDDEKLARDLIKNYLSDFEDVNVIAESSNAFDAVKQINELKPDLIFLDIQLPKINGFELLEIIDYKPAIIFSTAYHEYAIKAFEVNAIDYLLKPYNQERFNQAVKKTLASIKSQSDERLRNNFQKFEQKALGKLERIVIKRNNEILIIPIDEIIFIEAQDDYVNIVSSKGKYLKYRTLKFYKENLPDNVFIKVHRSYIINISKLHKVEQFKKGSYIAILKDSTRIPVSKNGFERLKFNF